jgi:galactokinase
MERLTAELHTAFARAFGGAPHRVAAAPGRVNLIGEHTDYNDGFVLPMAIDRYIGVAFAPRTDEVLRAHSPEFDETVEIRVDQMAPGRQTGWVAYLAGMVWAARRAGLDVPGLDVAVLGRVPIGAGLSSSAAVEMAMARAICEASGIAWNAARMALLGQQAEREYVGVSCGIMDQFASAMASGGSALLLDCRSLRTEAAPIPAEVVVVVMDTGVRRTLAGSAYNERYAQCQEALGLIQLRVPEVRALRDVTPALLKQFADQMDPVVYRRAQHVTEETLRPREMAEALRGGRLLRAGRLMNDSHRSLKTLYEVSSAELDCMAELAERHPACYGARLTGAGFGGCAVALVRRNHAAEFIDAVSEGYRARFSHPSHLFACEASDGAVLAPPLRSADAVHRTGRQLGVKLPAPLADGLLRKARDA